MKGAVKALLGMVLMSTLGACVALDEAPLEREDLGIYIIRSFQVPLGQRGATAWAQRMVGKAVILGPDRVAFPDGLGLEDCRHQGYRLSTRSSAYIAPFDLGQAGTLSLKELEIDDREMIELWSACLNGAYLNTDRSRLYLPAAGALFILERR